MSLSRSLKNSGLYYRVDLGFEDVGDFPHIHV